jgi:hypothetical protein
MDLESKETLNRGCFREDQLRQCMSNLYSLRYCDLFDGDGNFFSIAQIELLLGTEITPLQVFQLRNVCSVTKIKYSKKNLCLQKSVHIEKFLFKKKKGSSHIRKVLLSMEVQGIPHNINKFSNNMDIVVSGDQAKFLNSFWTSSFLSNQDKTFFLNFTIIR